MGSLLLCQTCSVVTTTSTTIPVTWLKQCDTAGLFNPSLRFSIPVSSIVGGVVVSKRENGLVELDPSEIDRLLKQVNEVRAKGQKNIENIREETAAANDGAASMKEKLRTFFLNSVKGVLESTGLYSDLVLLCADNEQVFVHQSIMSSLSPMMRKVLLDQKNNDNIAYISLDQNSDTVKILKEILYTGEAVVSNHHFNNSVQELLKYLDLDISIVSNTSDFENLVIGETEGVKEEPSHVSNNDDPLWVFDGNNNDALSTLEDPDVYRERINENIMCEISGGAVDSQLNLVVSDEENKMSNPRPNFNVAAAVKRSLCAYVQMKPSDLVSKLDPMSYNRRSGDEGGGGYVSHERSSKFQCLACQDCSKKFKHKRKLTKHLVDDHYYEELENLLISEFLECKNCCAVDFSKAGFDAFIRHKAQCHGAVDLLMKKAPGGLDSDGDDIV